MRDLVVILVLFSIVNYACCETTILKSCDHEGVAPAAQFFMNNTLCREGPCIIRPGSDVVMVMTFKSPKYLENIQLKVKATAMGVVLEYPLFQDDACVGILNTYCPLVKDEIVEYSYTLHILDIFPEATVGLQFTLIDKDDGNSEVLCFGIDIQIKKG